MAEFVHQYVAELLKRQHAVAQQYPDVVGTDLMYSSRAQYNVNLLTLILIGTVMKTISEVAPIVTDEVWLDRLNHALDASEAAPWPQWLLDQNPDAMT